MKKLFCFALAMMCAACSLFAQSKFELIPMAGYTFADQVSFYSTQGRIESGANYGGSFQFNLSYRFGFELMYSRMEANSAMYFGPGQSEPIHQQRVAIDYIMAGPVQSFSFPESPARLFLGVQAGAAVFSPGPFDHTTNTKFAWGLQGGTDIYLNPRLGIRLKGQLLSAVAWGSTGYYFGHFGSGIGISTINPIYQFGFTGGLIIGLGKILPKPKYLNIYQQG